MSFLNFLKALPGAASRFGGITGLAPAAGATMAGFSGAALDPLLQGSQYAQRQLEALGVIPKPGSIPPQAPRPTGSLRNYGANYKQDELNAGAAAEAFRAGAGFPGQQRSVTAPGAMSPVGTPGASSFAPLDPYAAQNREYERERARVEAMVKANPDMQKQAIADERAKVRDQGMAIWAAANPTLAKQVKPGAVGYDAIQQGLIGKDAGQAARQAFGYQTPQQITLTPPPGVNTPQGMPAVQSIQPAEAYTTEGLQVDPEMRLKFQSLLNLTNK